MINSEKCPRALLGIAWLLGPDSRHAQDGGFGGDVEKALRSIKVPILYMPSETDLYFPIGDARYEATFIPGVSLTPIPSLWGHTAGAASNPADAKFLNEKIGQFLSGSVPSATSKGGSN